MTFQQYIQQKKLDISIIDSEKINLSSRIDSEYFQIKFINLENNIKSKKFSTLENISQVNWWKRLPKWETFIDNKKGIPYARIVDIQNNFIEEEKLEYISYELHEILNRYQIKNKDILVSIVWTLWLIWYNQLNLEKFNFTENCARLRTKNINPEYLLAILSSSIWQLQVEREKVWTNQPKLSLDRLRNFIIPISSDSFQNKISKTILDSLKQKEFSKKLYLEAENLLLSELWLENYKPTEKNISIKDSEEVDVFWRFDAEYFQPKYDEIFEKIWKYNTEELWKIVDYKKWVEPWSSEYQENWIPFIRVSDVWIKWVNRFEKYVSEDFFEKLEWKYQAKKWDILFTKDWTIWITFVFNEDFQNVLSWAFLILQPKINIDKNYLALVLNSIICKLQIERFSWWALIAHLKPSDTMNLKIPILWKDIQEKITKLVKNSHEALDLSKQLLEKAKKSVEVFIEKDEKEAEKIL